MWQRARGTTRRSCTACTFYKFIVWILWTIWTIVQQSIFGWIYICRNQLLSYFWFPTKKWWRHSITMKVSYWWRHVASVSRWWSHVTSVSRWWRHHTVIRWWMGIRWGWRGYCCINKGQRIGAWFLIWTSGGLWIRQATCRKLLFQVWPTFLKKYYKCLETFIIRHEY